MGKIDFGQSKFSKFLNGKGFYVALAVCLVGAGVATWAAVNSTLQGLTVADGDEVNPSFTASEEDWDFPDMATTASTDEDGEAIDQEILQMPEETLDVPDSSEDSSLASGDTSDTEELQDVLTTQPTPVDLLYMLPVSGDIINDYSHGELVKSKTLNDWRTHDGIDIRAAAGTTVQAVADGVVANIYDDGMWGTVVVVDHADGLTSIYASLNEATTVKTGDTVGIGDIIGTVGDTAESEVALETHLHFSMMKDGEYVDPLEVMPNITRPE